MNLDEIEIKFIHLKSDDNSTFHDEIYPLIDSNKNIYSLKPRENILIKMTSDSVFIKKSNGIFQIVIKYKNHIDSTNQSYSYFQNGGRVVIGVVSDIKAFRKTVYEKYQLLNIYDEEKSELEDKYPFLVVSEIYGFKESNSLYYVATKMNTEWGVWGCWGSNSRHFRIE